MTTPNYTTLTVIGGVYGVFAQDVGRWLKGLGLRDQDGRPTEQAIRDGFVKERLTEFGGSSWLWHEGKVCELLDGMCYQRGGAHKAEKHDGFVLIRGS